MTQQERVAKIKPTYRGYDISLDSKCNKPSYYGIQRIPEAEALIKPKRKRKKVYYLSCRMSKGQEKELRAATHALYNMSPTEWLRKSAFDVIEEHKKAAPTAVTVETASL